MVLVFDIAGVSVAGVQLPLSSRVFEEYQNHLPESLASAAQVRKEDYVAGRLCAFKASALLGLSLSKLPTHSDRTPIWPQNLCGSISHSKKLAVSCVSSADHYFSLGIDAEEIMDDHIDISEQVANANELALVKNNLGLTILFSAKEALYKAIYPIVKSFVDFKEVEMTAINFSKNTFEIDARSENLLKLGLNQFQGSFQIIDNTVVTLITIKHRGEHVDS